MISIDTNILLADNPCHVSLLVLAELGYVLTSLYEVTKAELLALVASLLALPGLHFEHEPRIATALAGFDAGLDWFDAMLWAAAPATHPLLTFDRRFARKAASLPAPSVRFAIEAR